MEASSEAAVEPKSHGIVVTELRQELAHFGHSVMRGIVREEFELFQGRATRESEKIDETVTRDCETIEEAAAQVREMVEVSSGTRISEVPLLQHEKDVTQKDSKTYQAQGMAALRVVEQLNNILFADSPFVTDGYEAVLKESGSKETLEKVARNLQDEVQNRISFGGFPDQNRAGFMHMEMHHGQEVAKIPYSNSQRSNSPQRRNHTDPQLPRKRYSGAKDRVPTDTSLRFNFVKDRVPTDSSLKLSEPGVAEQQRSGSKSSANRLGRRHYRTFTESSELQIEAASKASSSRKIKRISNSRSKINPGSANSTSQFASFVAWKSNPMQDASLCDFTESRSSSDSPSHKQGKKGVVPPCEATRAEAKQGTIYECLNQGSSGPDCLTPQHRASLNPRASLDQKNWGNLATRIQNCPSDKAPPEPQEKEIMCSTKLEKFVRSSFFDSFTLTLICLNALSLGWQADYLARHTTDKLPALARAIEIFFCTAFSFEVAVRIAIFRKNFFRCKDWRWNCFDCLVVALQITEEFMALLAESFPMNFSFLRVVRVVRLVRVIRLVRLLRLISELRTLVTSLLGSLKSFGWTMVLLFGVIYTTGIFFTQIATDYRLELPQDNVDANVLKGYFGSLEESIMVLIQGILGGVSWREVTMPLKEEIHWFVSLAFCMYIIFSVLAMMNVVTGVFVDSALSSAKNDKEIYLVNSVRSMFKRLDLDLGGELTWEQFEQSLGEAEMREYFKQINVDISEAHGIFDLLDINCSGKISTEEFVSGCMRISGYAKALDILALIHEVRDLSYTQDSIYEFLKGLSLQDAVSERIPSIPSVSSFSTTAEEQQHLQMCSSNPCNTYSKSEKKL